MRPPEQGCVLARRSLRQRALLVTYASPPIPHRQPARTQRNLQRQPVLSAVTGVTGLALLKAMRPGNPLPTRAGARGSPPGPANASGGPRRPAVTPARRCVGSARGELTARAGSDEHPAVVLLSESGTDMRRWATETHVASWLGLCPHPQGLGRRGALAPGAA